MSRKSLDIGCGRFKLPGSIGLDVVPLEGVDVVHDLDRFPYPFPSDSFDHVRMSHVVEHIQSIVRTMEEVHRIARPGALVEVVTPHYTDTSSWQDPSHRWHLNSRSFEHFEEASPTNYYSKARFSVEYSEVRLLKLYRYLGFELLINLQNRSPALPLPEKILGAVPLYPDPRKGHVLPTTGAEVADPSSRWAEP